MKYLTMAIVRRSGPFAGNDRALRAHFLPASESPIRRLILGGALVVAAIALGTAIMICNFRERALKDSQRELENTVLLLAHHYEQEFKEFDIIHEELVAHIRSIGISSSDDFKKSMSTGDMHIFLKIQSRGPSDVAGINIYDSEGMLVNSSARPLPSISVADRAYFQALKSGPAPAPVLIELVKSRISGSGWTALISRKVTGQNDEFLGLVTRGIATASFETFFAPLALGDDAVISMFHRDGTMLARYPHVEAMIGRNFSDKPFFQTISNSDHGKAHGIIDTGRPEQLASSRELSDFPIVIVATTSASAALVDWRDQTRLLVSVATLLVTVIIVLLFLVVQQLSKQHLEGRRLLAVQKQRLDIAVNNMTQGLLLFDSTHRLVLCNQRYLEMLGWAPDMIKPGCTIRDLIMLRAENGSFNGDIDEYCSILLRRIAQGRVFKTLFETGQGLSIQVVYKPLADGGWVTTLEDITERRRAEKKITHLAHYDALTGLSNRVLLRHQLEQDLARLAPGVQLAVLYVDIDEFKSINDVLGHPIGDELLKSLAAKLTACIRQTDFVARLGGDEFAIIQTDVTQPDDVTDLVARIYEEIRKPLECAGHQLVADASIGIALAPQHGVNMDELLKNADLAMYSAKADGGRKFRFFESGMDARMKARRVLEMDLRQAIVDGDLEVHYQPLVNLQTGKITGCEALLRWSHRERGMISPAEFIPVAEETGLIDQLGDWVLATACAEAATWPEDIRLAVNVSPVQFRSKALALKVVAVLASSGLPACRLELEITEAVLIRDDEAALAILHQLRSAGIRIALDDFGTGYSSLSYLQRFPFDKIKIDRCFVSDIGESDGSSCIVQAVVNIAASRNMTTTAEGVETEEQRDLLKLLGCTEMQGNLLSSAKPASELKRLFASRRKSPLAA